MGLKILQINLNHSKDAQDVCTKYMNDKNIGIVCISEPHRHPENYQWIAAKEGLAAILWNPNAFKGNVKTMITSKNYVIAQVDEITVVSIYISPNINIRKFENIIDRLTMDLAEMTNKKMIICGDFNAHSSTWNSKKESARGNIINEWMATMNLEIINRGRKPTCIRAQGKSIVDISMITTKLTENIKYWKVLDRETLSDHRYIIIEIAELKNKHINSREKKKQTNILTKIEINTRWKWEKINEDLFSALMTGYEWTAGEDDEPELQAENIKKEIIRICKATIPRIRGKSTKRKCYWWSERLTEIHGECNKLRRAYMRRNKNGKALNGEEYKEWKHKQKEYRQEIRKAKREAWKETINALEEDPWGKGYKIALKNFNKSPGNLTQRIEEPELKRILDGLFPVIETNEQKQTQQQHIQSHRNKKLSIMQRGPYLRMQELEMAVKKIARRNPAPGPDGITAKMLKHICGLIPFQLCRTFDKCLTSGVFPKTMRRSKLVLLKKEGKPDGKPSSYRPICLTEEITKLFERIINKRIIEHLETQERQISEKQYGFRVGRSTTDAVIAVKRKINEIKERGNFALAVSVDIKNAFNSIRWHIIEQAAKNLNFPIYLQKIIGEYLRTGEITYIGKDGNTKHRRTYCGVPQGSVLGPTLWNIGFNSVIESKFPGKADVYAYADDLLIVIEETTAERLINATNLNIAIINNSIKEIELQIEPTKTEAVIFHSKIHKIERYIKIENLEIKTRQEMKYLGVILDEKLTFISHIKYVCSKAEKFLGKLQGLVKNTSGPPQHKRILYANVINSILLYAAPVWAIEINKTKERRKIFNKINRLTANRMIRAYRTVSMDATMILAGTPPTDLIAMRYLEIYNELERLKSEGEIITIKIKIEVKNTIQDRTINQWKKRLKRDDNDGGRRIRTAIAPMMDEWIGREEGEMNYEITQMITGHGVFKQYLWRMGRNNNPECKYCGASYQDNIHIISKCPKWSNERMTLRAGLCLTADETLDIKRISTKIVENMRKWNAFDTFSKTIIRKMMDDEREEERSTVQDNKTK